MGGGLCRPADAFPGALPLSLSIALPLTRHFVQATLEQSDIDPFLPSHVSAFLSSSLPPSLSSPSTAPSQQQFARALFRQYHHPPLPTLTLQQVVTLVHDLLLHSSSALPSLLSPLFSQSLSVVRTHLHPVTRNERALLAAAFAAHQRRAEERLRRWLDGVREHEEAVGEAVWKRLLERSAGRGVTEAVFVDEWAAVSEEVMATEARAIRWPGAVEERYEDSDDENGTAASERAPAAWEKLDDGAADWEETKSDQTVSSRVEDTAVEPIADSENADMRDAFAMQQQQQQQQQQPRTA